jgi:hypothetical protein
MMARGAWREALCGEKSIPRSRDLFGVAAGQGAVRHCGGRSSDFRVGHCWGCEVTRVSAFLSGSGPPHPSASLHPSHSYSLLATLILVFATLILDMHTILPSALICIDVMCASALVAHLSPLARCAPAPLLGVTATLFSRGQFAVSPSLHRKTDPAAQ